MAAAPEFHTLRLLLGDQLNPQHSWFRRRDPGVLYLLAELRQEATYARHHVQKVAAFFAAMRAFAGWLDAQGHRVQHLDLDATAAFEDLGALLRHQVTTLGVQRFEYQRPDEYRLLRQLEAVGATLPVAQTCCDSEHFLVPFGELGQLLPTGKAHRMERFYRGMRRRLGILVDGDGEPVGGRWNFDAENRERLPQDEALPSPLLFRNPVADELQRIERHAIPTLGTLAGTELPWPINREQSLELLHYFLRECLPRFGRFQDAMTDRGWSLFHSRLSFSLNTKMLSPAEVVDAAIGAWQAAPDTISLAQLEGFVRQVIGWREFMRGIYWANMPAYAELNSLGHQRPLPHYYWDGDTRMACMAAAIGQSLRYAYAHHIQRLMVTGNFALLAGVEPDEVDAWYLGIYIDAIEWVELPNTRGMSQFADGGIIASKPYCASGQYIKRMSDHCAGCHYDVGARSGPDACPFNSLYWDFMLRHRERLARNPRVAMLYRNWDRMDRQRRSAILATAARNLERLEEL